MLLYKRGRKIHLAVDGMPVRIIVTEGTTADCTQACKLIEGIEADALLADRAYDTDEIIQYCENIETVIPPKRNRKIQRTYELYRIRHLVENAFLELKRWVCYSLR